MREILFKAKRIDTGEWVEGLITFMWGQYHIINPNDENTAYPIDTDTICQCTGLKDKNGKLIWENDIMVAHLDEDFLKDETYIQVVWHNSGFCTMENGSDDREPLDDFDTQYFAVCGNIFDNAELLERKE